MKSILISIKPKWVAKILNGEKTIEVRKNKALANAIKKLIDENGYADIYVCCSKDNKKHLYPVALLDKHNKIFKRGYKEGDIDNRTNYLNGKIIFKFRCYKVEGILPFIVRETKLGSAYVLTEEKIINCQRSQLTYDEYNHYLNGKVGYAIYISDLEIFDKPKELSEYKKCYRSKGYPQNQSWYLTKAPQNFTYINIDKGE